MIQHILISILFLCIVVPFGTYYISGRKAPSEKKLKIFKFALSGNVISFFAVLIFSTIFLFSNTAMAETGAVSSDSAGMAFIGAALSVGLGSLGTGIATGSAASAALGALSENEKIMGKALIFVALAEGIAIYGLIIAFMILNRV